MYYVSYGSNINSLQMNHRVPGAKPIGTGYIHNYRLAFHGNDGTAYATICFSLGKCVPVVVWEMSAKQESIMDRYEGYPKAYYKRTIPVHINNKIIDCLIYIMNESRVVARPSRKYVNTIRNGYKMFGLNISYLENALETNSKEFYNYDLMEVREYTPIKNTSVKTTGYNKNRKKGSGSTKKSYKYPTSDYWYMSGMNDDYIDIRNKKVPSLDDYDLINK